MAKEYRRPEDIPQEKFKSHKDFPTRFYDTRAANVEWATPDYFDIPGLEDHWNCILREWTNDLMIYCQLMERIKEIIAKDPYLSSRVNE